MARRHLAHLRLLDRAAVEGVGAAGVEAAARGRVDRARHVALEDDALLRGVGVGHRHRRQQRLGVGVLRPREQRGAVGDLDDLAEIHDRDAVADVLDDRDVVGDEQIGEAELALQVAQQVDDLRLHRDVERRDRLVADDQARVERQRAGDADALALAAGEFVRVAVERLGAAARPCRPAPRPARRARGRRATP